MDNANAKNKYDKTLKKVLLVLFYNFEIICLISNKVTLLDKLYK